MQAPAERRPWAFSPGRLLPSPVWLGLGLFECAEVEQGCTRVCGDAPGGTLLPSRLSSEKHFCPLAIPQDQKPCLLYLRLGGYLLGAHCLPALMALSLVWRFDKKVLVSLLSHLSHVLPVCDLRCFRDEETRLGSDCIPQLLNGRAGYRCAQFRGLLGEDS